MSACALPVRFPVIPRYKIKFFQGILRYSPCPVFFHFEEPIFMHPIPGFVIFNNVQLNAPRAIIRAHAWKSLTKGINRTWGAGEASQKLTLGVSAAVANLCGDMNSDEVRVDAGKQRSGSGGRNQCKCCKRSDYTVEEGQYTAQECPSFFDPISTSVFGSCS